MHRIATAALIAATFGMPWTAVAQETATETDEDAAVSTDATTAQVAGTGSGGTVAAEETGTARSGISDPVEDATDGAAAEGTARLTQRSADPIAEAEEALEAVELAVEALIGGDAAAALPEIERAVGELEVLIARRPALALAPAATDVVERDVVGSLSAVEAMRERIEDLVDDGRIQEARAIMRDFGSELVLRTENLPLAAWSEALKSAAVLAEAGDAAAALDVLTAAIGSTVITEEIVPLPNLRAELLLLEAESLLAAHPRPDAVEDDVEALLDAARAQIELGRAFGYGDRRSYRALLDEIDEVEDEASGTPVERAFERVRGRLADLFD